MHTMDLPNEAATQRLGERLAGVLRGQSGVIYLQGGLGAGKTTLVRALLKALGVEGRVVSPTYTLVEPYNAGPQLILHMDLYRLTDPEELEYLGIRDMDGARHLLLVEWPAQGRGMLPAADMVLHLDDAAAGRRLGVECLSAQAEAWAAELVATNSQ